MSRASRPWRRTGRPATGEGGFSLIEVMVGLVLMTIGVLGMAAFTVTVTQANRAASNWTRADQVLHEKIEEFQTSRYPTISAGVDTTLVGGIEFVRTWTVDADTPLAGVKLIEVQSAWREGPSERTSHRTTYIAEAGR